VALERIQHRLALLAVQGADGRDMGVEQAGLQHFVGHALREAGRVEVSRLLGLHEFEVDGLGGDDVAQAHARCEDLRERAHVEHAVRVERAQRRQGIAGVAQLAVRIVFDQQHAEFFRAGHQGLAALQRQAAAGRVLEVRDGVEEARAGSQLGRERFGQQALVIAGHRRVRRLEQRERLQGAQIAGCFHQDLALRVDEHLAQQVQPLLRAGRDEHARSRGAMTLGNPFTQRGQPLGRAVLQCGLRIVREHAGARRLDRLDREGDRRRQAAGERDHLGALGDLEDFPDRRAGQLLRAAREGAGGVVHGMVLQCGDAHLLSGRLVSKRRKG